MKSRLIKAAAGTLLLSAPAHAAVTMPAIFGDHMVLQQDVAVPVWGMADPGEKVIISVNGVSASTHAGPDRKWRVNLPPLHGGDTAVTMTVTGENLLKFEDVLIGDVWLCSGQSNMEFGITRAHNAAEEIPKANISLMRLFVVPKESSLSPLDEIQSGKNPLNGRWQLCTPETVADMGDWTAFKGFSAVGYFFGREIQKFTGRPVGMIESTWGGTPAQSWVSLSGLQKEPALKQYADAWTRINGTYAADSASYPARLGSYQTEHAKWESEAGPAYDAALKNWNENMAKAQAAGLPPPPKPQPATSAPASPLPPDFPPAPTVLFNGMIAPVIPYALKGIIWYQGESNANNAPDALGYRALFSRLIGDWREKWGQSELPFLFVQLARFQLHQHGNYWALLRKGQSETLQSPKTGMAVAFDIGDPYYIHPADKMDVGLRLAEAAKHVAYGANNIYSGPTFNSLKAEGSTLRISFLNTGNGLTIKMPPWSPPDTRLPAATSLAGFTISGSDGRWLPATAGIDGNTVTVSNPQISSPVAVRYEWAEDSPGNLYNTQGLPAVPFSTAANP